MSMLGGSVSLASLIKDRRLRFSCLATATRMKAEALDTTIEILGRSIRLQRDAGHCDECDAVRVVVCPERA
jgi:hypothetical protein